MFLPYISNSYRSPCNIYIVPTRRTNVLIENQNEMLSQAKPLGSVSEVQAIGGVIFPATNPAIVEIKTSEMPPEFREFIDSKVIDTTATPVVGSHWWGG